MSIRLPGEYGKQNIYYISLAQCSSCGKYNSSVEISEENGKCLACKRKINNIITKRIWTASSKKQLDCINIKKGKICGEIGHALGKIVIDDEFCEAVFCRWCYKIYDAQITNQHIR